MGNAVERNRARRLLREAVRHLASYVPPGWDVVLVARRAILKVQAQRVQQTLKTMLQGADLWSTG